MKRILLLTIFVTLSACTGKDTQPTQANKANLGFATKGEAVSNSPAQLSCEKTEVVPTSRGRGFGVKTETVTFYYPGYLRGDVNNDGVVNRDDAMLAVQQLFKANDITCPRTADVGGAPQTTIPDGYFTSQDIYLFNQFKHDGIVTWPNDVICGYDCAIPNHMAP